MLGLLGMLQILQGRYLHSLYKRFRIGLEWIAFDFMKKNICILKQTLAAGITLTRFAFIYINKTLIFIKS